MTVSMFLQITLDAMSQLFFSLSVSMGIMITYGSHVKPDVDLGKSISMIEIMDTGVALLAGVMIIPAVYVFFGVEGMSAGPGLMFISLPKVFFCMGAAGRIIGLLSSILIGWIMKPAWIAEEMERGGKVFRRKKLYTVMIRYIMPVIMLIIFLQSTGIMNYLSFS